MYYYSFHIGDYRAATAHLTNEEDLAYRRLLDWYYDTESPISLKDTDVIARRLRMHVSIVERVLLDMFSKDDHGNFRNKRADQEIRSFHEKLEQASKAGRASAERRRNGRSTDVQSASIEPSTEFNGLSTNHEPITNNHKPKEKKQRGFRLPTDFEMPKAWEEFAEQERPDLTPKKVFESFKDYWTAKPGAGGVKLDWFATWRNWIRSQAAQKSVSTFAQVKADVAKVTVPENPDYEATRRRVEAEASIPKKGPTLAVLERMAAIRKAAGASQ